MSSMVDPPATDRLSARLRRSTGEMHDRAQGNGFLGALAAGRLPRAAYADLAGQHWFIYEALELAAGRMATDPVAGSFVFPQLNRLPAIEADLLFLHGPDWADRIAALPATMTYRARLREVAGRSPVGFVAHHYTRYLGDLSGGQYLGHAIARAVGLGEEGHRFFRFEVDPAAFKDNYRRLLDTQAWSRSEQDEFVVEVTEAYRLNIAVLAELRRRWP